MSNQPVPNPIIGSPVDDAATISTVEAAAAPVAAAKPTPQQRALQQQIQTQLQNQLQAQLQAAASRGKQANITPEMIQAQAQAMVQAAAQAQAVVAAAKNRGGGLVPMNAAQIDALSQIQARAIVNARPQTALVGSSGAAAGTKPGGEPTPQQIQNQIQLQAQALVHAHTQAQIAAGIFKETEKTKTPAPSASSIRSSVPQSVGMKRPAPVASTVPLVPLTSGPSAGLTFVQRIGEGGYEDDGMPVMDAKSPEFLAKMEGTLTEFWAGQLQEMRTLGSEKVQTEQDFKNHNDLPLARIKRIMKSDEDVRMISAEAPVLFAKACEMFILEMTLRSWNYSENNKRKTLLKEDVKEAIQRTDIFDFLVDVID